MAEIISVVIATGVLLTLIAAYIWSVAWAISDATKRGHGRGHVIFLFWLFGPLAVLVWLIIRPQQTLLESRIDDYSSPDDALAAATRLDSIGEWDAAIDCFTAVAQKWPEHSAYARNCISSIEKKRGAVELEP